MFCFDDIEVWFKSFGFLIASNTVHDEYGLRNHFSKPQVQPPKEIMTMLFHGCWPHCPGSYLLMILKVNLGFLTTSCLHGKQLLLQNPEMRRMRCLLPSYNLGRTGGSYLIKQIDTPLFVRSILANLLVKTLHTYIYNYPYSIIYDIK